jgi:hypothetical protein
MKWKAEWAPESVWTFCPAGNETPDDWTRSLVTRPNGTYRQTYLFLDYLMVMSEFWNMQRRTVSWLMSKDVEGEVTVRFIKCCPGIWPKILTNDERQLSALWLTDRRTDWASSRQPKQTSVYIECLLCTVVLGSEASILRRQPVGR